ncbi:MAG: hypothetical protein ACPIB0_01800 [Akkermansiaceae bacterium]
MKNTTKLACTAALIALTATAQADNRKVDPINEVVAKSITSSPEKVTDIVFEQVVQNPSKVCEIVKTAIVASKADKNLVAGIVEAAAKAAPDKTATASQCAMAVAPDAIVEVQVVFAKLSAAGGAGGMAPATNSLDFPGNGPVGPTPGGPGGFPLFPPGLQPPTVSSNDGTTVESTNDDSTFDL